MVIRRNAFTYAANIFALGFSLILFFFVKKSDLQFRILALTCIGVGACASLFYVCNVLEPSLSKKATIGEENYKKGLGKIKTKEQPKVTDENGNVISGKTPGMWMKEAQFYIFGVVYMSARIALNTTATMMPLYLTSVTKFTPAKGMDTSPQIASVPLVQYICSLLFSVCLQAKITQSFRNRLIPMIMAVVTTVIGSVPLGFLDENADRYIVYPCAVF